MKAASLAELKKELKDLSPSQVADMCILLAKFKKENKELLTYLMFEKDDEQQYISGVKSLMDELFEGMNQSSPYLAKKTIRKVLRTANKYIKFSGSKQTEVELLLHFCLKMKESGIRIKSNPALLHLYERQQLKIHMAISKLHEDLQYDYQEGMKKLKLP